MKEIHRKLLELAKTQDLGSMTYRKIAGMIGDEHPYQVQYNIRQLIKAGLLLENHRTGSIYPGGRKSLDDRFVNIPILGGVSCGVPVEFANNEHEGFLTVSPSLVNDTVTSKLFALKAVGDSMNLANINGESVDDGDYVMVRNSDWGVAKSGDYVVSLIGDVANLKKLQIDKNNRRIILLSETTAGYPPIIIADEDMSYYRIMGIATGVIKAIDQ